MKFFREFFVKPLEEVVPPPVKELNVTEPIISFVKTVKDNPKRFKHRVIKAGRYHLKHTFKDRMLNKSWLFWVEYDYHGEGYYIGLPSWVTIEESLYLYKELSHIYGKQRKEKLHNIQRERMKRIYN